MMHAILKFLKPSALAAILLMLILLVQGACFTSGSMTHSFGSDKPDKTSSSYGIGSPIKVTTVNGVTSRNINWPILLINFSLSYLLAAVLASAFARGTRFRRPAMTYGAVALVMVLVGFFVSISMSRAYWGYYFSRPPVPNEVQQVKSITAVIPVTTEALDDGTRRMILQDEYSIADRLACGRKDQYYCLDERLLLAFDEMGLLPNAHTTELPLFPGLFSLVEQTGILAEPEEGYNDSDLLSGVVIDALSKSGRRLVFVGLTGRQLSNDHYPYYEMVFTGSAESSGLSYIGGQRFFFDVAGIEGAEWYLIWPFLALIGVLAGFVVVTVFMLIWRLIGRSKVAQQSPPPYSSPATGSESGERDDADC